MRCLIVAQLSIRTDKCCVWIPWQCAEETRDGALDDSVSFVFAVISKFASSNDRDALV